jgi:hypothetical protein
MAITQIYGSRPNAAGWQRATSFHPYDDMGLDPGDALEKNSRSISGGTERARSAGGPAKQQAYKGGGTVGVVGGQARSPYQR